MNKTTIIEAQNSNTVFEEGKQKGTLGVLKGIFADYKNGTRNSDRLYSEELWDNRVFGSEDVMEALETKTLFGELDHPEGDRCETLAQNAAITITKLEKRPEEGVIYGEAEILDTPTGRIVKALADSGARLGISSRGMGEEIYENGQNIIDPNTYDFITFDVVVTPANTKARVSLAESKHIDKLTESLKKEIKESETVNQLDQIKTVVENMNVSNKEELLNLIESKTRVDEVKDIKFAEANKKLVIEMLTKQLDETIQENTQLKEAKEYYEQSKALLRSKIVEANNKVNTLKEELEESKDIEKQNLAKYQTNLNDVKAISLKKLENKELEDNTLLETINKENNDLRKEKKELEEKLTKFNETNEKLLKTESELSKILMNNKKLQESNVTLIKEKAQLVKENKTLKAQVDTVNNKLTESKTINNTQTKELQSEITKLKEENAKLTEAKERLSKVSFNRIGEVEPLNVNDFTTDYTPDEMALFSMLTNK